MILVSRHLACILGVLVFAPTCAFSAEKAPTLKQTGAFIQRQLDGALSVIATQTEPYLFFQITKYVSVRVSRCSAKVVVDEAFGDADAPPALRESYAFSFKAIDPTSFNIKDFFEAGLLEFNVTTPITLTSVDAQTKKAEIEKFNSIQFRFQDVQTAKRAQQALTRAAQLCGAKKDVF